MSGVTRQSYSPEIRIIRLMCTGRVDLAFILRAFEKGADGVIVGGCWPGECHYVTEGNYDALGNMHLAKKLLANIGLSPERMRLEWISASEGSRFAEVMSGFVDNMTELGPIGAGEGVDKDSLKIRMRAICQLVPYIKLVERERLRVPTKSEEAYNSFYNSMEINALFDELFVDKIAMSQILLLLKDKPLTTGEISGALGLNQSEVSRHMNSSARQGFVRYDVDHKCYALS